MAQLSTWKPFNSEHILPNDAAASEFQYRFFISLRYELTTLLGFLSIILGLGQDIVSSDLDIFFHVRLKDGETVLFEQQVTITINIVALIFSIFGSNGLGLFTWAFKKETIQTLVIAGDAISAENPAWKHTIGGTELSEFGTMEKGGGSDYTDIEAIIEDWWDSPVYIMPVPVGCEWEIVTVQAEGGGSVPNNLLFQFRFDVAGDSASYLDIHGAIRSLIPARNHLYIAHTYEGPNARWRWDNLFGASDACLWKEATNRIYIVAHQSSEWRVWYSDTEGLEILPLLYTAATLPATNDDLEGQQVRLWIGSNWRNVDVKPRKGGGVATCAMLDDDVYFQAPPDIYSPAPAQKVPYPHDGNKVVVLIQELAGGSEKIILHDNVLYQVESNDGGLSWTKIE